MLNSGRTNNGELLRPLPYALLKRRLNRCTLEPEAHARVPQGLTCVAFQSVTSAYGRISYAWRR